MVGTVKKSTDAMLLRWFWRKLRQVCDGGFRRRTRYLLTLVSPTSIPSFSNSPWMRGAPQSGLSRLIWRINFLISWETGRSSGLPVVDLPSPKEVESSAMPADHSLG